MVGILIGKSFSSRFLCSLRMCRQQYSKSLRCSFNFCHFAQTSLTAHHILFCGQVFVTVLKKRCQEKKPSRFGCVGFCMITNKEDEEKKRLKSLQKSIRRNKSYCVLQHLWRPFLVSAVHCTRWRHGLQCLVRFPAKSFHSRIFQNLNWFCCGDVIQADMEFLKA